MWSVAPLFGGIYTQETGQVSGQPQCVIQVIWKTEPDLFWCWIQGQTPDGRPWQGTQMPSSGHGDNSWLHWVNFLLLRPSLLLYVQAPKRAV